MKFYRPTIAEVDLSAIRHNLNRIKEIIGKDTKILGVVKADAYGHGMKEISDTITKEGIDYLGVSSLDEARELRGTGIRNEIIMLGVILPEEAEGVLKYNVIQTVSDLEIAGLLSRLGRVRDRKVKIHIKIDTGMGRLGFWYQDAVGFIKKIALLKNIVIDGIWTHFPSAEYDKVFTEAQLSFFKSLVEELGENNINIPIKHTSNSIALIDFKVSHMNMVRPGLLIYGLHPRMDLVDRLDLKPCLTLKTKIAHLKSVPKGRSISYGRTYVTKKDTKIGTIPIGYGDGYSRLLSNRGTVLIKSTRCPIVGRVCMDMCMVDVGHLKDVKIGDEVVLIGMQGSEFIRVEEIAGLMNTIPYEVVCNISQRVPRVYLNKVKSEKSKVKSKR